MQRTRDALEANLCRANADDDRPDKVGLLDLNVIDASSVLIAQIDDVDAIRLGDDFTLKGRYSLIAKHEIRTGIATNDDPQGCGDHDLADIRPTNNFKTKLLIRAVVRARVHRRAVGVEVSAGCKAHGDPGVWGTSGRSCDSNPTCSKLYAWPVLLAIG